MGDIFIDLLNTSITASWLIIAVLLFRLLLKKTPKWISCLLWGMVALRLICPISLESHFSLVPTAETIKSSTVVDGEIHTFIPSIDSSLDVVENTINPMLQESFSYEPSESVSPLQKVTFVAGIVWLCGMVMMLLYMIISRFRIHLLVRESVRYHKNIYLCDSIGSPFILGVIKPRIYLNSGLKKEEMQCIVAHERAHLMRKDHLWKPLGFLLLCIYWFHPLCWVAFVCLCRDIEMACDEKVIRDMSFEEKKEYSRVLVSCGQQRRMVMACPLAFGEVGVKERVKSVLHYKKPTFWLLVVAVCTCFVVAVCFLTNPPQKYQIRITIPAGSKADFCYSEEEISPKGNTLTVSNGEGLGDCLVVLRPVEVREENAYEPTYMTPGMPVKMDVEKGAWFQIGVNMQNPEDEDIHVYVTVKNVEVRIADSNRETDQNNPEAAEWITEEINVEKSDVTHDGVADYIVTSMSYDPSYVDANASLKDRMSQQTMYDVVCVKVYEGENDSDTYREENLLWSQEYSRVHVGNGQLSIVQVDGKDYMLTSSLYCGQGFATWDYEVFSLNGTDKEIIDKQSVEFDIGAEDAATSYKEFQSSLSEYINQGILIVACDIDFEEQLIRTQESPYLPENYYGHAFTKFDGTQSGEVKQQEPDGESTEVQKELVRVVDSVGLENAWPWNNTVDLKENADALIKMASDETGKYEIYGIMSAKYGTYGLLLNDWIDGEQNWNFAYVPWMYSGAPSDQPILEPDGNGKYVFAYVCKYEDGVPYWEECILDCGYDTGHMELLSLEETIEDSAVREDYYEVATSLSTASEVEKFARGIKEDVLSGDWASLSDKLIYPITIDGHTLNDSSDFLELDIDRNLSQEFVNAINAESCRKMFCNWQGIMMGVTGQIWFTDVDEGSGMWELKIIGINRMLDASEEIATPVAGVTMVDTSKIASIIITNGNTGEKKTITGEEVYSEEYYFYNDLRKLYGQLDFSVEAVENERVGYQYSMALYDADGSKLQMITPYKDGLTVDRVFYQYDDTGEGAKASLRLMEYMEYIFNPEA